MALSRDTYRKAIDYFHQYGEDYSQVHLIGDDVTPNLARSLYNDGVPGQPWGKPISVVLAEEYQTAAAKTAKALRLMDDMDEEARNELASRYRSAVMMVEAQALYDATVSYQRVISELASLTPTIADLIKDIGQDIQEADSPSARKVALNTFLAAGSRAVDTFQRIMSAGKVLSDLQPKELAREVTPEEVRNRMSIMKRLVDVVDDDGGMGTLPDDVDLLETGD